MTANQLADDLHEAWQKYVAAFGEAPHGTLRQLTAMLEFMPKRPADETATPQLAMNAPQITYCMHDTELLAALQLIATFDHPGNRVFGDDVPTRPRLESEVFERMAKIARDALVKLDADETAVAPLPSGSGWDNERQTFLIPPEAEFGRCGKCGEPITSSHNINGCSAAKTEACRHSINDTVTTSAHGKWLCRKCGAILSDEPAEKPAEYCKECAGWKYARPGNPRCICPTVNGNEGRK